jgi:hypothetical protein
MSQNNVISDKLLANLPQEANFEEKEDSTDPDSDSNSPSSKRGIKRARSSSLSDPESEDLADGTWLRSKKDRNEFLANMICVVCEEFPRVGETAGPIHNCRNGHLLCQTCLKQVKECPICRNPDIFCRNLPLERILALSFKDQDFKCKHAPECKAKMKIKDLTVHEKFCSFREVFCPSNHRNACNWRGTLHKLVDHMKEKKCCQVIFDRTTPNSSHSDSSGVITASFKSNIGDMPKTSVSVFKRSDVITHWKPIVLLSKSILNFWCYLLIQRDSNGNWTMVVHSLLGPEEASKLTARITIGNEKRNSSFIGPVNSFMDNRDKVLSLGNYLSLKDSQVKNFRREDANIIFDYAVEIKVEPELISLMSISKIAHVGKTQNQSQNDKNVKNETIEIVE